jgi:hypothetical protein
VVLLEVVVSVEKELVDQVALLAVVMVERLMDVLVLAAAGAEHQVFIV